MKNLVPRKFPIKKAQSGLVLQPMFTEADAGFPNSKQQLKKNQARKDAEQALKDFINSGALSRMADRFNSVLDDSGELIPIYAEPDNTPEWIKNVYYFFNPSRKPMKVNQYKKIR